jgi:hypothetical protein
MWRFRRKMMRFVSVMLELKTATLEKGKKGKSPFLVPNQNVILRLRENCELNYSSGIIVNCRPVSREKWLQ